MSIHTRLAFVDEETTILTTVEILKALGTKGPVHSQPLLVIEWLKAASQFGYYFRQREDGTPYLTHPV